MKGYNSFVGDEICEMIWTKGEIVSIENSGILRKSLLLPAWSITS